MTQTVTAEMVKELRACTGVGMSKCKEALVETGGDMQKAIDYLRKAGMASAVKKEGRETKEGKVGTAEDKKAIAVVEISAETDFVVQNERFQTFLDDLCQLALATKPKTAEEFSEHIYDKEKDLTVEQYRNLVIQALGENIIVKKVELIDKDPATSIGIYSHMGGKIVSIVEIEGSNSAQDLAREIAMHVAAENPEYVNPDDIPKSVREREEDIARSQVKGKPEHVLEKIIAGKLQAYCNEFCLNCQKFVKDSSITVEEYLTQQSQKEPLKVRRFWRWKV